jgi:hypothetical protein
VIDHSTSIIVLNTESDLHHALLFAASNLCNLLE